MKKQKHIPPVDLIGALKSVATAIGLEVQEYESERVILPDGSIHQLDSLSHAEGDWKVWILGAKVADLSGPPPAIPAKGRISQRSKI